MRTSKTDWIVLKMTDVEEGTIIQAHWYCLIAQATVTHCAQLQEKNGNDFLFAIAFYVVMFFGYLFIL